MRPRPSDESTSARHSRSQATRGLVDPRYGSDRAGCWPRSARGAVARRVLVGLGVVGLLVFGAAGAMMFGLGSAKDASAATGSGNGSGPDRAGDAASGAPIDRARASIADFDVTTLGVGALSARRQEELRSTLESEAAIVELAKEGTTVKKGDVVARLNTDEIDRRIADEELQLKAAVVDYDAAKSQLEITRNENDSNLRKAKLKVDLDDLDLRQWQEGEVRSKRKKHEQDLDAARTEVVRAQERLNNARKLQEQGFISREELQTRELEHRKASATLELAQLDQSSFEAFTFPKERRTKESNVEEAKAELERTIRRNTTQLAKAESDEVNRRGQVELRERRLVELKKLKAGATMIAPTDGLVVYATSLLPPWYFDGQGPLQIGRKVSPNQMIAAIPDTSEMLAEIKVPESIAGRIKPGQTAWVKIDAASSAGARVRAKVDSVGVMAERTWGEGVREFSVKLALEAEDVKPLGLRPAMRCDAEITLTRVAQGLSVPAQAVFAEGPVRYVLVPRGSSAERRPVKVGARAERLVEVLAGLKEGETVLTREPRPGEVIQSRWSAEALAVVGLEYDPRGGGQVVAKAEPKPAETKAEPKPEVKTDAKADIKSESKAEAATDTEPGKPAQTGATTP